MITLYDLVFQDDRRPSPFCWRAKFALKHKGLGWRDEPVGFTEKQKIAFAQSQTVPVIHDGPNVVKDSWAIAQHLDAPIRRSRCSARRDIMRISSPRGSTLPCIRHCSRSWSAIFTRACGRSISPISSTRAASGWAPPTLRASRPRRARRAWPPSAPVLEPARRVLKEQPFLSGEQPPIPTMRWAGAFLWARVATPLALLEADDPVHAWRERMLDLFDGMGRKAKTA
jgi:glutathione S-transferase